MHTFLITDFLTSVTLILCLSSTWSTAFPQNEFSWDNTMDENIHFLLQLMKTFAHHYSQCQFPPRNFETDHKIILLLHESNLNTWMEGSNMANVSWPKMVTLYNWSFYMVLTQILFASHIRCCSCLWSVVKQRTI